MLPWIGIAFVAGAVAAGALLWHEVRRNERQVRFMIQSPAAGEQIDWPVLSPDGTKLAFVSESAAGERTLWVRDLASTVARALPGTNGATQPFWSPASDAIAFFGADKLQVMRLEDAKPRPIARASAPRGASWGTSGAVLYTPHITSAIWITDPSGSKSRQLTRLEEANGDESHRWPEFLPDGEHFLLVIRSRKLQRTGLYVASVQEGILKKIATLQTRAIIARGGWMFFVQDRKLWRQPFDLRRLELRGTPVAVASDIAPDLRVTGATRIAASNDGSLAFASAEDARRTIVLAGRDGKTLEQLAAAGYYVNPSLSPDGKTLAFSRIDEESGRNSIWLLDISTRTMSAFVDDDPNADGPVWSVDGGKILYTSDRRGAYEVYERSVGSVAADRLVLPSKTYAQPVASTRAGFIVNVARPEGGGNYEFWHTGTPSPEVLFSALGGGAADATRDGKWIAYIAVRNENTRYGIDVASLQDKERKIRVSPDGCTQPTWRADSRELYYADPDGHVIATEFRDGQIGASTTLFQTDTQDNFYANRSFVPSPDGSRFIVLPAIPNRTLHAATVVLHWDAR